MAAIRKREFSQTHKLVESLIEAKVPSNAMVELTVTNVLVRNDTVFFCFNLGIEDVIVLESGDGSGWNGLLSRFKGELDLPDGYQDVRMRIKPDGLVHLISLVEKIEDTPEPELVLELA